MQEKKFLLVTVLIFTLSLFYKYNVNTDVPFAYTYAAFADTVVSSGNTIRCQTVSGGSEGTAEAVEEELGKIPASLRKDFVSSGWHIYTTKEELGKNYFNSEHSSVYGCTFYDEKLILISDNEVEARKATIHEFGHFFDYNHGYLSETDEFKIIYEKEHAVMDKTLKDTCKLTDTGEYFAECFSYYINSPELLKQTAPETYFYIHGYVSHME